MNSIMHVSNGGSHVFHNHTSLPFHPVILVEFDPASYIVNEDDGAVEFDIVRRTPTSETVMVLFSTAQLSGANAATSMCNIF